jgi:hypothetical protein
MRPRSCHMRQISLRWKVVDCGSIQRISAMRATK